MTRFITCRQIVKAYRISQHEIVALRGIDFEMEKGEMVAIIGPSGAGKSSLLKLLGGLDTPTAGSLNVGGLDLLSLKGKTLAQYRLRRVQRLCSWARERSLTRQHTLPIQRLPVIA